MNHSLSQILEFLEHSTWGFRFRVTVRNDSAAKLFLPFPEMTSLKFGNTATHLIAEWQTHCFVSTGGGGFTLTPGESTAVEWQVRPCSVEPPAEEEDLDYGRWCIALSPGEYLVWSTWEIDEDYFDPDSHMRIPELEYLAEQEAAVVWRGRSISNRIQVTYPALSARIDVTE